jgi:hypothetical protein
VSNPEKLVLTVSGKGTGSGEIHGAMVFDPILKERLFGLTNSEGNHGEDVKEYYFYLDSTPTHSYMKEIVERAAVSIFHSRSFGESVAAFPGGSWKGLLSLTAVLFVVLIPFFGFGELRRVFGYRIVEVFLRPRHLVNLPTRRILTCSP